MQTNFYIISYFATPAGPEAFARFEIGNNSEAAYQLFNQLKGDKEVNDQNMLCLELMETVNELPVNMDVLSCTLDELTENFRLITKESFKQQNLNGSL